jgi:predicted RNA binding protein YcfA (HicA-like mRNA interferase family)
MQQPRLRREATMDKYETEIEKLLHENGAVLVRQKKHRVYRFPDGREVVMASTPSDHRATLNKLTFLRRMLDGRLPEKPAAPTPTSVELLPVKLIRRGQAPRPERSNANVVIPKLGSGTPLTVTTPTTAKRSLRECDPYYVANSSEEFWRLDPCGRIRAIGKVVQATGSTAEYVDVLYGAVSHEVLDTHGVVSVPVFQRVVETARYQCHPAVIVGGDTLVEAYALPHYKGRRRLLVSNYESNHAASYRLTRNVSLVVYPMVGELARIRKKFRLRSNVTEQWVNPKLIRAACEEILNGLYQPAA